MLNGFALPRYFSVEKEGKKIFIFKEGYEDIVRSAGCGVRSSEFRNPQSSIPNLRTVRGRGEYPRIPLEGGGTAIVRRVRHGGLWGKVVGDLCWGIGRPVRELMNASKALERGIPTAEILGIRLERHLCLFGGMSLPLYRAEVFLRELPETIDLLQLLSLNDPLTRSMLKIRHVLGGDSKRREIIRAVALSVRVMHEAGLYHNDLHLKNILITREAPFKVYIIDLDKSSLHESLSLNQRIENLLRLDRSVEKFMTVGAYRSPWRILASPPQAVCLRHDNTPLRPITQRDKLRFLRDYMGGGPAWKETARSLNPGHTFHRWWWRVFGVMGIDPYGLRRNQDSKEQTLPTFREGKKRT